MRRHELDEFRMWQGDGETPGAYTILEWVETQQILDHQTLMEFLRGQGYTRTHSIPEIDRELQADVDRKRYQRRSGNPSSR